jgi:hypothetical protein
MSLWIANLTGLDFGGTAETLYACVLVPDDSCISATLPGWRKKAWYKIAPRLTANIVSGDVIRKYVVGIYVMSEQRDKDWQGTESDAKFKVNDTAHFDQCALDDTNCTRLVDFYMIDSGIIVPEGTAVLTVYVGPLANQIAVKAPMISVSLNAERHFATKFQISGTGFSPLGAVVFTYEYQGIGITKHISTDTSGGFSETINIENGILRLGCSAYDSTYPELSARVDAEF